MKKKKIRRRIRFASWIPKATEIHSEYLIPIAFPTATTVTRKRHNGTLYVCCFYCVNLTKKNGKYDVRKICFSLVYVCIKRL